jgi:hypothetical protein
MVFQSLIGILISNAGGQTTLLLNPMSDARETSEHLLKQVIAAKNAEPEMQRPGSRPSN